MISQRILDLFKEHNTVPKYKVEIVDIKNNEVSCNQDSMTLKVKQIYSNGDVIERDLIIYSDIDIDSSGAYRTYLNGYIGDETPIEENDTEESSHYIEVVDAVLEKSLDITFNQPYINQPKYHVFVDKKYESLYRDTSQEYIKNKSELYTGIKITFNNLKTRQTYPKISILIIGDEKTENDTEGVLTVTTYKLDSESKPEYIEGIKVIIKNISGEEIFEDETGPSGECSTILHYLNKYTIEIDDEDYTSDGNVIIFSKKDNFVSMLLEEKENTEVEEDVNSG